MSYTLTLGTPVGATPALVQRVRAAADAKLPLGPSLPQPLFRTVPPPAPRGVGPALFRRVEAQAAAKRAAAAAVPAPIVSTLRRVTAVAPPARRIATALVQRVRAAAEAKRRATLPAVTAPPRALVIPAPGPPALEPIEEVAMEPPEELQPILRALTPFDQVPAEAMEPAREAVPEPPYGGEPETMFEPEPSGFEQPRAAEYDTGAEPAVPAWLEGIENLELLGEERESVFDRSTSVAQGMSEEELRQVEALTQARTTATGKAGGASVWWGIGALAVFLYVVYRGGPKGRGRRVSW